MKKTTDPPRLAIWLLTRRLSAEWRDFVVGDLEEEFATRSDDSPVAAHTWLWWQTVRCLAAPPPVRPNPLPLGSSQGDSRMRTLFADFRYASRMMSRTPSFAVAVVSVLALGIGANTAIFSIVNAVLLRPLPFEEPERLVRIFTRTPGGRLFELSPGNLLFTRALSRRKEIAIRFALGAARGRVFQQLLTEALLLAAAGGALGLLLAYGTLTSASTLLASQVPRAEEISIDWRVLLFAVGVSMLTGMLAGTLPAVRAGRSDLNDALKEGGGSDGAIGVGTRRLLIVCEVALSLVLLMGAGVMIQSLLALRYGDTGFDPNNVLTMRVRLVDVRYPSLAQRSSFFDAALQRIRALPGVEAAGTIDDLPLKEGSSQTLHLEEYPPQREPVAVQVRQITPGYLRAMGIPVLRGRDIVENDADVLLVSRDAAKLYWGADDPIGRRATLPAVSKTALRQVVGIVGDVKQRNLIEASTPTVYFYTREPYGRATFVIRTSVPPVTLAQPAVAAIRAIDPEQPVGDIRTMVQVLDGGLTSQRFSALLLGVFAGVALLLAAVGIYSVLSYIVRGRSREIGIRTALGARTSDVLRLVILEGMSPALVGIAAGTIAALASAKVMETLVFGVSPSDPLTLAAVAATLALVALMASLVPAYRALRLDPVKVLRAD